MKRSIISTAITMAAIAGIYSGNAAAQNLAPVSVSANSVAAACTPPNDSPACDAFHAAIRAHFSARQIGILFGAITPYPENLTGARDRLMERYGAFVQEYQASLTQKPNESSVASR